MTHGPAAGDELLTVAIPFHGRVDYLELAVRSVQGQQDPRWRLLVLDDSGVAPGPVALFRELDDPRVEYLRNPGNLGMVPTWNRCLDLAGDGLVTLLHADDMLHPGYVGLVRELAARHPQAAAVCCDAEIIDEHGSRARSLADSVKRVRRPAGDPIRIAGEAGLASIMAANFIMCPTLCFRMSVIGARRFDPQWKQVQDLDFTARLLLEDEEIVCSRQCAYAYRRHAGGATALQSENRLRFDEEYALFDRVADAAERRGWKAAARVSRRKRIVKLHLGWRALSELLRLRPVRAASWLRYLAGRR